MDQQMIDSITELQNREKQLHNDFHSNSPDSKQRSLEEMQELMRLRVAMFDKLRTEYVRDIERSESELDGQLDVLFIVENELEVARERLKKMNKEYTEKMRMVEFSTYFSEKYRAYNGLFLLVFKWAIPIIALIYLSRNNPIPETWINREDSNTMFLVVILLVSFYALYKILILSYDLNTRNNMNFNEYDFGETLDFDKMVSKYDSVDFNDKDGIVHHDLAEFEKLGGVFGCTDSTCCADGTMYDSLKKRCVIATKNHKKNTQNASLTKGSMGAALAQAETGGESIFEGLSNMHVPFSGV